MNGKEFIESIKLSNDIQCTIDSCDFIQETNMLYIRGWVFSIKEDEIKFDTTKSNVIIDAGLSRYDVYKAFEEKYKSSLYSGFLLSISDVQNKERIGFKLSAGEEVVEYQLDISKIVKKNKKYRKELYKSVFNRVYFKRGINYLKRNGFKRFLIKSLEVSKRLFFSISNTTEVYDPTIAYFKWMDCNEVYDETIVKNELSALKIKPLISIVIPVYDVEEKWLRKCIESVMNQYYVNWELCIADDCSTKEHVKRVLEEYKNKDARIKVFYRDENGHISKASNSALSIANGEFVALLDNDDEIPKWALYEVVSLINKFPQAELIYSDEDKIDTRGNRIEPHFKPDWSPDTMLSCNYITHLCVIKKQIVDDIGGFRVGYEGSQDYDIILRASERTKNIYHIPKILYHWRMIEGSTSMSINNKNYAYLASIKVLEDAIIRRGEKALVKEVEGLPIFHVSYFPKKDDYISIIIPTRNGADILRKCLVSIYEKSSYRNFEIIVINNGSTEESTFELFKEYNQKENFTIYDLDIPFNYSKLNNMAAEKAKGNLLLFLNNDIEVISENWLDELAGQAGREHIGAVGVKLLYPNNKIQHCGIVLGAGGVAANAYSGMGNIETEYIFRLNSNYNFAAVTAACMMVRKKLFFEVGGFTEELAVAFNDVDFCVKVLEKGYYNICIPRIKLYHHESISRGADVTLEKIERFSGEVKYMENRWSKWIKSDPFYNPNFSLKTPYFHIEESKARKPFFDIKNKSE